VQLSLMPFPGKVEHQLLLASAAWLPCALDRRRLASASVSSKAIIAILSKTRPIARMLFSLSIVSCGQFKRRGYSRLHLCLAAVPAWARLGDFIRKDVRFAPDATLRHGGCWFHRRGEGFCH
jgi:hypothetical protein